MPNKKFPKLKQRLASLCSQPTVIAGIDQVDGYREIISLTEKDDEKIALAAGAAAEFGLPGLLLLLNVYSEKLEQAVSGEERIGMALIDLYMWLRVAELINECYPNAASHHDHVSSAECKEAFAKIRNQFRGQLQKETGESAARWLDSANVNAEAIFKACAKDFDHVNKKHSSHRR